MNRSESIAKVAAALVKAQRNMGNAVKDSNNPFFKSKYADLNAVREACLPALNAEGISVLQPTTVIDGKNYVETILLHESGEFISGLTEIVVKTANNAQEQGGGISYARRYGLQSTANLGSEDDDGETALGRGAPAKSAPKTVSETPKMETGSAAAKPSPFRGGTVKKDAPKVETPVTQEVVGFD